MQNTDETSHPIQHPEKTSMNIGRKYCGYEGDRHKCQGRAVNHGEVGKKRFEARKYRSTKNKTHKQQHKRGTDYNLE